MEQSAEVLRFYRDWITDVPDELTTVVVHRKALPLPVLPRELHGRPIVSVICCYAGPLEDGERVVRPPGLRFAAARPVRQHPVRRPPGDVRRLVPGGLVVLLPILQCRDPDRRGHRHHRRPCPAYPLSADGLPDLSSRRRGRARRGRRDRVQRSDRRAHLQHQCHHREQEGFEEERGGRAASGRPSSPTTPASTSTS